MSLVGETTLPRCMEQESLWKFSLRETAPAAKKSRSYRPEQARVGTGAPSVQPSEARLAGAWRLRSFFVILRSKALEEARHLGFKRFPNQRMAGRSKYSGVIVQYNLHRHVLKQSSHAPFVQERLHEDRVFHPGHDFCRNTASDENAAGGHKIQSAIASLRSVDAHKDR